MNKEKKQVFFATSNPPILEKDRFYKNDRTENLLKEPVVSQIFKNMAEFLMQKNKEEINLSYIGGYGGEKDINIANAYCQAFSYYLEKLCNLKISFKLKVITEENYTEDQFQVLKDLNNTDFLVLGVGVDSKIGKFYERLNADKISLSGIIKMNNIFPMGICAGSVLTAENILGSDYDYIYMDEEKTDFPDKYPTITINQTTMETNLFPEFATEEENQSFKKDFLYPLSFQKAFFGCRPFSYIMMSSEIICAVGETYVFTDGKDYLICKNDKKADLRKLNSLINRYNQNKTEELKREIEEEIKNTKNRNFDIENRKFEEICVQEYSKNEIRIRIILENRNISRKQSLYEIMTSELTALFSGKQKDEFSSLETPSKIKTVFNKIEDKDYILSINLISIIRKYFALYDTDLEEYLEDVFEIMKSMMRFDMRIPYYFISYFSSFYPNKTKEMKAILEETSLATKRLGAMTKENEEIKNLWRIKDEKRN